MNLHCFCVTLMGVLIGCGDDVAPPPGDASIRDVSSTDVAVDAPVSDGGESDADDIMDSGEEADSSEEVDAQVSDASGDSDMTVDAANAMDSSPSDADTSDAPPINRTPRILSVNWDPPTNCDAGSGLTVFIRVLDDDTPLSDLTPTVTFWDCAQGATTVQSDQLVVPLTNCAHDVPVAGLVRVVDPDGHSDMENSFVVRPCQDGEVTADDP